MGVHRPADIKKQQYFHCILTFGLHLDVEHAAVVGRRSNGVVEVQFFFCTRAGKLSQPPQCHLYVAGAKLDRVVKVLVLTIVPGLFGLLLFTFGRTVWSIFALTVSIALFAVLTFLAFLRLLSGFLFFLFFGFLKGLYEFFKSTKAFDLLELFRRQRFLELAG